MLSTIAGILGNLPFIGKLFDKLTPAPQDDTSVKLERVRLERDHVRALGKGKVTPKMAMRYAIVGLLTVFGALFVVDVFFPDAMDADYSGIAKMWQVFSSIFEGIF